MALPPAPRRPGGNRKPARPGAQNDSPPEATGKKGRNPIERGIVWGLISLLLVGGGIVVAIDRGARRDYDKTVEAIRSAMKNANDGRLRPGAPEHGVKLTALDGLIAGKPARTEHKSNGITSIKLDWKSVMRSYTATVESDEAGELTEFWTGDQRP